MADITIVIGERVTLSSHATAGADGRRSQPYVAWTTSDAGVVSLGAGAASAQSVVATGVAAGTATVTATAGGVSATYVIEVEAPVLSVQGRRS